LALHDLATGADRLLTNDGAMKADPDYAEASAISRDGRQVAYGWESSKTDHYELRVLRLSGDPTPRRVFANPDVDYIEPRDWSPDGKWIAVLLAPPKSQAEQIGLIAAQDGSLRVLKSGTGRLGIGGFSPDGRYLLYTIEPSPTAKSFIMPVDGNTEVSLVSGTHSAYDPVWTPDGSRVVFVSDLSGSPGLWSTRVVNGKPLGEPERLKADFNNSQVIGFARDGSLFCGVDLHETDVYLAGLDPATGKLTSEPKRVNESPTNSLGHVAWLPDGKSLSFYNKSPSLALMVHTLSTREEREVWGGKSGRTGGYYTGWFPDGSSLMSAVVGSGQTIVFRRMDSTTGEVHASWTVPAVPSGSTSNVFSPDLMTMFFAQKDGTAPCEGAKCTYLMLARSLETGRDREIFRIGGMWPRNASVSHDGDEIAFTASDDAAQHEMVAPTAGGPPREIYRSADGGLFLGTAWTPDGGHVLALRHRPTGGELWSLSTKGGLPENSPLHVHPSGVPAVSPDGTQVAFNGDSSRSEIWVMTGLFQETKPVAGR
jgi:Tol biopolymer transport system component